MSTNHNRIKVADLEINQPNRILTTNENGEIQFTDVNTIQAESYNDLDYTAEGKALDARQGKILKDLVDNINLLLASDNVNLNTIQQLVDAIKIVQTSLSTLLINDLTTGGIAKALTAEMGKNLKVLIDSLGSNKVDKATGERLINMAEQIKLTGIQAGAQVNQDISGKQDISNQIEVNTSGLVQDSWHGKLVIFTASITLTVPASGLRTGFSFEGIVDPVYTVNTTITAPKTWKGPYTGAAIPANSIFAFLQQATNDNKVSIYGL